MTQRKAGFFSGATLLALSMLGPCACSQPSQAHDSVTTTRTANTGGRQENTMESAKRRVPQVAPVTAGGIRYEVLRGARSHGFPQNGGVIAAVAVATGKELWTLTVYTTDYDPQEEADVQDVFITSLTLSKDGKTLLVKNEDKQSYAITLAGRTIAVLP